MRNRVKRLVVLLHILYSAQNTSPNLVCWPIKSLNQREGAPCTGLHYHQYYYVLHYHVSVLSSPLPSLHVFDFYEIFLYTTCWSCCYITSLQHFTAQRLSLCAAQWVNTALGNSAVMRAATLFERPAIAPGPSNTWPWSSCGSSCHFLSCE